MRKTNLSISRLYGWLKKAYTLGTSRPWTGWTLISVAVTLLVVVAGLIGDPDNLPAWTSWLIIAVIATILALGAVMQIRYYEIKHEENSDYSVTKSAQIGYILWFMLTSLSGISGIALCLSGRSPSAGAIGLFSGIFLVIGWTMAGFPGQKWRERSLNLLKRISNWQLLAGSAVIAVIFELPSRGESLSNHLGLNYMFLLILCLIWILGAGLLTVLLEPLKHKMKPETT